MAYRILYRRLVPGAAALAFLIGLAAPEPVSASGATPLPDCTVDQNPPYFGGAESVDIPCANNTASDHQGGRYILLTYGITNGGVFTPGADAPQRITFEILLNSDPSSYRPIWADCFGDACNLGFIPNPALIRTRDGTDPFSGVFQRNGAYGWRMKKVAGQEANCYSKLTCDYDLVFTNGFQDVNGNHIPTLEKDQQAIVDTGGGQISIAFNRRVGGPPPTAGFVVTPLGKRKFRFDASTSSGAGIRYEWKFGDGETLETTDPIVDHTYKVPGKYLATLRVIDADDNPSLPFVVEVDATGILVNSVADRPRLPGTTLCDTGEVIAGGGAECTLRAAISALNDGVADTIEFGLPAGAGAIQPASNLPDVTRAGSTIDGDTQPTGEVVLSGRGLAVVGADHVTIKGLTILGGTEAVLFLKSADGLVIGNSLGVTAAGVVFAPRVGVVVVGSPRVRIGGVGAERNVIGGDDFGVRILGGDTGEDSDDVVIRGNLIGIDGADRVLATSAAGIFGLARVAGGAARRALIEDNTIVNAQSNVLLLGSFLDGATVRGNRIGVNPAGTSTVGQPFQNVRADEVPNLSVRDNDISGATYDIIVAGSIQTKTVTQQDGQQRFEFREPGDSESGKAPAGVNAVVAENRVGLVGPRPLASSGIALFAGIIDPTVEGNVVAGHGVHEIDVREAERAVIADNTVGLDAPSTAFTGIRVGDSKTVTVRANLVGGVTTAVAVGKTKGVTLTDNVVGVGQDGVAAKGVTTGLFLIDGSVEGAEVGPDNTFANAATAAIATSAASAKIFKNKIGITRFGSFAAPNGIGIDVSGGTVDVHDNTIANSTTAGVNVGSVPTVTLRANAIYNTAAPTFGIKGAPAPPAVTGAARVTSGTSTRTWLVVTGLPTTGTGVIEVFGNPSCTDPEGKVPLFTKASEKDRSTRVLNVVGRADLHGLTVTYTGEDGKTSSFSDCATPAAMPDGDGDGIPDIVEAAAPLKTETKADAASVVADNDQWITLIAPSGATITDFRLFDDPDPNGHPGKFFPLGFFTFTFAGVPVGEVSTGSLLLPPSTPATAWWKQAPPSPGAPPSLWNFVFEQASGTGAITGTDDFPPYGLARVIHLSIADGGRGDEDFAANGSIRDPGAPSICADDDSYASIACRLDSFRCYQAKPSAGAEKFDPIRGVRASGQFDDVLVDVKKPLQLCAPADTTDDGVADPDTHLEAYAATPQKGQPKIVTRTGLRVTSELGTVVVDTGKLLHLLVPTAEDPVSSPVNSPALIANRVDRFACYQAKLAKSQPKLPKTLQVTVADALAGTPLRVTVKKLARLCTPVGANGNAAKDSGQLLCFQVVATKGRCTLAAPVNPGGGCKQEADCGGAKGQSSFCVLQPKFVKQTGRNVANELDVGRLDAAKADVVCLPAALEP